MQQRFHVPPRGALAECADSLALPVKRLIMWPLGLRGESPQLTHFWNNIRLPLDAADHLDRDMMVHCMGDPEAPERRYRADVRFHLGWWKQYVVVQPRDYQDPWYVGWVCETFVGASQIPVSRRTRVLIGPGDVSFFGVRARDHMQIPIDLVGRGILGDGGPSQGEPLR